MITKPKGTYDIYATDASIYKYIENYANEFSYNYNCKYMRTPIFESSELFHRSVGEFSDIVSKETYDFIDRGNRSNTLRPEGTAGIVRSVIENKLYGNKNETFKYFYFGPMYRYERPQAGRNREFTQFGVESFNSFDPLSDAEVISMGYNFIKGLGIDNLTVRINSLGDKDTRINYEKALKEYFKPHLNKLCEDCQKRYENNTLRIIDCKYDMSKEDTKKIIENTPSIMDYQSEESIERLDTIKNYLLYMDVDFEIDKTIVRGLDYYDYNVWEYVTDNGVTLGGGGRYNSLVKTLDGPELPAVGFALGIERLMIELKNKNEEIFKDNIDVYILSVNEEEKLKSLIIAQELRLNNISVEINSANLSLKSQFKIADSLNAKQLIILNTDDLNRGMVTIKDNLIKEETKVDEQEIVEYLLGVL